MTRPTLVQSLAVAGASALLLAACGSSGGGSATTSAAPSESASESSTVPAGDGTEAHALAPDWGGTLDDDTLARTIGLPVLLTLGADGAALVEIGQVTRASSPAVAVVDTTGAGDAFLGAYADSVARRLPPLEALEVAAKAGAYACSGPGARHHATPRDLVDLSTA